jgi:hypothetical protein
MYLKKFSCLQRSNTVGDLDVTQVPSARDHVGLMAAVAQARDLPQAQPTLEKAHGLIVCWLAAEVGEPAQRASVGNPLAQFAIVPVLDTHQDQRAQHLLRRQRPVTRIWVLTSPQVASYQLNHLCVVIEEVGDRLQKRLQDKPLLQQLPVGKADLWIFRPRHRSARRLGACPLQGFDVPRGCLVKSLLQRSPILQAAPNLRHKLFRNVNGKPPAFQTSVQNVACVLFARLAGRAVLVHARGHGAGRASQTWRATEQPFAAVASARRRRMIRLCSFLCVLKGTRKQAQNDWSQHLRNGYLFALFVFRDRN